MLRLTAYQQQTNGKNKGEQGIKQYCKSHHPRFIGIAYLQGIRLISLYFSVKLPE